MTIPPAHPVIFFDGHCPFCHGAVRWIARRDPAGRFRFASLESSRGRQARQAAEEAPGGSAGSLILEADGAWTVRSEAALRIAAQLKAPWPMLKVFRIVPVRMRDAAYNWLARNRYRWFGRYDACPMPTAELQERIIDYAVSAPDDATPSPR